MIRTACTHDDFAFCARIKNAVEPRDPVTPEELRERPSGELIVHEGGGYAFVDRSSVRDSAYTIIRVAPDARRRGIGSALLEAAAKHARALGVAAYWGRVAPEDDESLRFVSRRGFVEVGREVELVRELARNEGDIPTGIVELGEHHRADAYAVAVACIPDMPTSGPAEAKPFDEWAAEELAGPAAFVALDGDRVVGYAALLAQPASPQRLEHGLSAVLRSHRGRGLATALKRAQIAWAASHGYRELVTTTGEGNAAMRAVNLKLGYVERPAAILVRAPLV
jgi:mycothiol synthase